jgi:hypothetical protein
MLCMDVDIALSEVPVNLAPLTDDGDFKSLETSVAYNASGMALYWHFVTTGGSYTVTAVTPTTGGTYDWAHQQQGMYSIEIPASGGASINNDTEGFGWFTGFATGVLPWRGPTICFRAAALNNLLVDDAFSTTRGLAGTALPNAAADAAGGLPISDAGGLDLDSIVTKLNTIDDFLDTEIAAILAAVDTEVATIVSATTAAAIRTALGLASANLDTQLSAIDDFLDTEVAAILAAVDTEVATIVSATAASAIRAAVGLASANLDTQLSTIDDFLDTEVAAILAAVDTEIATIVSATAASAIRAAVGLASANLDTQLSAIDDFVDTEVAAILAAVDTEVASIISTLGLAGAGLTGVPWNASWDAEVQSEVDDALKATLAEGYRSTGAIGSVRDMLYELIAHHGESAISGTTKTLKKLDASTTAKTYTLDSATTPTSITETT